MLPFVNHYHYLPIITFLGGFKKEISLFCIILISLFSNKEFISAYLQLMLLDKPRVRV
jgi:hypothetical protein